MRDITNPVFHDEEKARVFLERERWPNGVVCPFCEKHEGVKPLKGKSMGAGWYFCNACDQQKFTVRTGSIMERSHVPLAKWAMAFRLIAATKKGMSSKQLQRMLGVSYRTAWFIGHRIREAMKPTPQTHGPIGGRGKTIEADETFVGGKAQTAHRSKPIPKKRPVIALVERGGEVRAHHVAHVTSKTLRQVLVKNASRASTLMTDDSPYSRHLRREFAAHGTVVHSRGKYVSKDGEIHTQTVESFFAILKRGINGSFHSVSEQHLQRYVDEFAFRWNTRSALGIEDAERASLMLQAAIGKRLTYRRPDKHENT